MGRLLAAWLTVAFASEMQDRADLPMPMDTWYKVVQGKRDVGYVHESFKRSSAATRLWTFEYALESEFSLKVADRLQSEERSVTALLDETYAPEVIVSESHDNGVASSLSTYTSHDERRVEVRAAGADPVAWSLPAQDGFHILPTLSLYVLRQNDTLAKSGVITLRTVDPRGQEKSGVEVVLEVGEPVRREYLGKEVRVLRITFLKPFPAASRETELREVFVDRYGRILEASMVGGARIVIAENRKDALAAVGEIRRQGRRDPFDKLTAMRNAAIERDRARRGEPQIERPRPTADSLMSDFAAAAKMADQVRAHKAAGDLEEARQAYLKMLVHLKAIREMALRVRPELVPDIEKARNDAELAWDGAAQVERDARARFVLIQGQMDNLQVDAMEQTHKDLQALRDRIEVEGRNERDTIAGWVSQVGTLVVQARTRRELGQARLEVTGITLGETETQETVDSRSVIFGQVVGVVQEVTVVRPFAMIDVNGRSYGKGDTIVGTQIRVDWVGRNSVRFSLRDQVRDVGLRR